MLPPVARALRIIGAVLLVRRRVPPAGYNKQEQEQEDVMRPAICAAGLFLTLIAADAWPATWQLSTGATLEEGGALEIARRSDTWELALGYVTEQKVLVHYMTPTCPYRGAPPDSCYTEVHDAQESVDPFAYFSVQRRFELMRGSYLRPQLGLGLVAQSDTNEYVSSPVNFSLSLGLAIGERIGLEWRHFSNADTEGPNLGQDALLLRWQFP